MSQDLYHTMMRQIRATIEALQRGDTITYPDLVQLVSHATQVGWEGLAVTHAQARAQCPDYQTAQR